MNGSLVSKSLQYSVLFTSNQNQENMEFTKKIFVGVKITTLEKYFICHTVFVSFTKQIYLFMQ